MDSFYQQPFTIRYCGCLLSLAAVAGCGSLPDWRGSSESTGSVRDEIINGDPSDNAASSGIVRISGPVYITCTGELLQNDVVITARHCVTTDGSSNGPVDTNGSHFTLKMGTQFLQAGEAMAPAVDVALLVLPQFFTTSSATWGWHRSIYSGTDASLQGASVFCLGYGRSTFTNGGGALGSATLTVSSTTTSELTLLPNDRGQIPWFGDSGGTCFYNGYVTGIQSNCKTSGTTVTSCYEVGPEAYQPWALNRLQALAGATIQQSTSQNVAGDYMVISDPAANSTPGAIVTVTPNWNPVGSGGNYLNNNFGVWYTGSKWAIFNQDIQAMPVNEAFNVSVGGLSTVETAATETTAGNQFSLATANYSDPTQVLIITPNWNPPGHYGVYNDHPTGVWYNGSVWGIYNDDQAAMPVGASFNVRVADINDGGFIHRTTASNVFGDFTIIDSPNLNGQPGARVFVTHSFNPGGGAGRYNAHTVGVWYTGSKWAIFNEDMSSMATGLSFNVMVRP
jgi:hypothetical protein